MLVKFLSILLIILINDIPVSNSQNPENGQVYFKANGCGSDEGNINDPITIKFNELAKYPKELKQYKNVNFKEIRILHLDWDRIKNHASNKDNKYCGLKVTHGDGSNNYYISFSTAYFEGNNFDNLKEHRIYCNIQQCDLGLTFFDKNKKTEDLNKVNENHMVKHAVLMIIKSSDNKMILGVRPHHKVNIRLGICPYVEWVPKKGMLEFISETGILNNGYNERANGYVHIVVPLYKKNYNSDEFICGKLVQPTMPDLLIGYKLNEDNKNMEVSGEFNPLKDDLRCHYSDDPQHYYHFGYLETDTNFMSERIMDVIGIRNKDSKHNFYAGQKIYIYNWKKIADGLKNVNGHLKLTSPHVTEEPKCIRNLKSDIKASILPTIGSVDSIKRHKKKNLLYRLIKPDDLDKRFYFKCLSKVEEANNGHMEEFYSRSAELSIKNEEKPNIIYTLSKNEIIFYRKEIEKYGSYRCKESKATKYFKKDIITMDKVYYLPDENAELELGGTKFNKQNEQYIGCIKQYESLGIIKKMRVEFGENVLNPLDIEEFSNVTDKIDFKENIIIYKAPENVSGIIMKCTYETPAETTFFTRKEIHFVNPEEPEILENTIFQNMKIRTLVNVKQNSLPWIIGIVCTVIIFCIIVIMMSHYIVGRIKKRRARGNSSMSSTLSGLSTLTETKSGLNNTGVTKSSPVGKSKTNVKNTKNGKDSKVSTSSTTGAGFSTSTISGKNNFNNVKIVAK
uniref:EGF-like domain-containing protein n=1 Tax=Strongyloides venezuelensis TaxID=75913 RepID=A0A0K0FSK3_STRVS